MFKLISVILTMSLDKFGHYSHFKFKITSDIDAKNFKITNVKSPNNDSDVVNKKFVDDYLKDFYTSVSSSLQSIIDNSNVEYINLKKSIEDLKKQINLNKKSIKSSDNNFKSIKQQVSLLEKNVRNSVSKIEVNYKDLINTTTNNIKNDLNQFKAEQDKLLKVAVEKILKNILDILQRIENIDKKIVEHEKDITKNKKLLDKQTIDTVINNTFFNSKFEEFKTKSDDFKVQLDDLRKGINYYGNQSTSNNTQYFIKFDNLEKRIQKLESLH